jgi:FAD/FMN-containing dehydrogenase/Fe-S oxidoreductase
VDEARDRRSVRYHAHPTATGVDVVALERALRAAVGGEVRFDKGSRAAYSTDASNFRQIPLGVVVPRSVDDIVATHGVCHEYGAPITNRGGGTSLSGETTNVAVIVDSSKYVDRLGELDPKRRHVWAEPGVVNERLRKAARMHGLDFGPDPATHDRCTIGGNIGNNSCGTHSVMAGRTSDNTLALDVVTYDGARMTVRDHYTEGEIDAVVRAGGRQGDVFARLRDLRERYADAIRAAFPRIPRRVSGYNLDELLPERGFNVAAALVGTESTCVTVLRAKLRLVPWPPHRVLLVAGYASRPEAADHVPAILRHGVMALEGVDHTLLRHMRAKKLRTERLSELPDGSDFLLVEFGGDTRDEALDRARGALRELGGDLSRRNLRLVDDDGAARTIWEIRESGLGANAFVPGEPSSWPGWDDAAVDPAVLGPYLREFEALLESYGMLYATSIYGHYGDGCLHSHMPFDLTSSTGVDTYLRFLDDASDLVTRYGGSNSGEHGDGQQRAVYLEKMFGPEVVTAFREFKAIWDPDNRMNPGKVVDAIRVFRPEENLRLGAGYRHDTSRTYFGFRDDEGSFGHATLRCVGVGKCRVLGGQTMCPSYQVLREEEHSTRGRARLLFEMLEGDVIDDGWRSREVYDALDLCLSCKGCKSDCPVGVDMATYKAEFLAHHYEGRLRPREAYAMGLVMYHVRLGARVPAVANVALHAPGLHRLTKWLAGVHPQRAAPFFAARTFREWFAARPPADERLPKVLLYPDTFSNHFDVGVAQATCRVLEAAGFRVAVPERPLCCGRPLFDYGMLRHARTLFRRNLEVLRADIAAGVPVVVPEPSCAAAFRDELPALLPDDPAAGRLAGLTTTLDEFLTRHAGDWSMPRSARQVLVQQHCHHKSVIGAGAELAVLDRMGVRSPAVPAVSCCGLAGSWGFERAKFDLSMQCGEQVLFPAVRAASDDTVVVADGFSCRSQIAQGTDRRAIHLAQFVAAHLPDTGEPLPERRPELAFAGQSHRALLGAAVDRRTATKGALLTGGAVAAAAWLRGRRR